MASSGDRSSPGYLTLPSSSPSGTLSVSTTRKAVRVPASADSRRWDSSVDGMGAARGRGVDPSPLGTMRDKPAGVNGSAGPCRSESSEALASRRGWTGYAGWPPTGGSWYPHPEDRPGPARPTATTPWVRIDLMDTLPDALETPAATAEPPAAPRGALLTVFLVVFVDLLGFGIVLPLLPLYASFLLAPIYPGQPGRVGAVLAVLMASFSFMQ